MPGESPPGAQQLLLTATVVAARPWRAGTAWLPGVGACPGRGMVLCGVTACIGSLPAALLVQMGAAPSWVNGGDLVGVTAAALGLVWVQVTLMQRDTLGTLRLRCW